MVSTMFDHSGSGYNTDSSLLGQFTLKRLNVTELAVHLKF